MTAYKIVAIQKPRTALYFDASVFRTQGEAERYCRRLNKNNKNPNITWVVERFETTE